MELDDRTIWLLMENVSLLTHELIEEEMLKEELILNFPGGPEIAPKTLLDEVPMNIWTLVLEAVFEAK